MRLLGAGKPADVVTLSDQLALTQKLDGVGGPAYLDALVQSVPTTADVRHYAEIVRWHSILRQLASTAGEIAEAALRPLERSPYEVLYEAKAKIMHIIEQSERGRKSLMPMHSALKEAFLVIHQRFESKDTVTGLATGFTDLDDLTTGLQPGNLIVIGARPSQGKTTFAMNIVEYAALKSKKAAVVFSMEMSASQLAFRLISSCGRIDQQHLRTGNFEEEEWPRMTRAITLLSEARIFIDDTPSLSLVELCARVRRIKREHDIGLVVIDYLQLIQIPDSQEDRSIQIAKISRGLKALAREMDIPVVVLSQLNRALEQRIDKRPILSDLRDAGAIEESADVILFIYRDEYYNPESTKKGVSEIIIGKQRNGEVGRMELVFLGKYACFENLVCQGEMF
jgi:replicative DNA helicase